jgi:hypothetical protein
MSASSNFGPKVGNANTIEITVTGEATHIIEWKAETLFSGVTY